MFDIGGSLLGGALMGPIGNIIGGSMGNNKNPATPQQGGTVKMMPAEDGNAFTPQWGGEIPTDARGRPLLPGFETVGDANTGLLRDPYNLTNQLNTQGVEAIRAEALRDPGTMSRWGDMALAQQRGQNAATSAGATTQAQNQLAMSGGLRTGARERLASQGLQSNLRADQSALQNVQLQDEQNRQKWLSMLPGAELQTAQYGSEIQDKNIGRALGEINTGRNLQQSQYAEAMQAWGADKTAQAAAKQANNPGLIPDSIPIIGGCFLTTACVDAMNLKDDSWPLEMARKFRDQYMTENLERASEIYEYYKTAPLIVSAVNKKKDATKIWKRFFWKHIVPFADSVSKGHYELSYKLYHNFIREAHRMAS